MFVNMFTILNVHVIRYTNEYKFMFKYKHIDMYICIKYEYAHADKNEELTSVGMHI
jgi:hypothetical protein